MSITQFEYYQRQSLHPSSFGIEDPSVFKRYFAVRKNLYENLLHLPLTLLDDRHVLEAGCGTGESSLVFALHNARMTMVDADPTVAPRQKELFETFGIADRIRRQAICTIDEYEDKPIFSLVTAEGFLFTVPNRNEMLKKLCRLMQPGGFCTISFPDRFGSFFEFLKKAVMWRAYQLEDIKDIHSQAALEIARRLFEKGYMQLPHARDFAVWWEDCLVSPFLTWDDCWAYDDILELVRTEGCSYYSSTPRVYEPGGALREVMSDLQQLEAKSGS